LQDLLTKGETCLEEIKTEARGTQWKSKEKLTHPTEK